MNPCGRPLSAVGRAAIPISDSATCSPFLASHISAVAVLAVCVSQELQHGCAAAMTTDIRADVGLCLAASRNTRSLDSVFTCSVIGWALWALGSSSQCVSPPRAGPPRLRGAGRAGPLRYPGKAAQTQRGWTQPGDLVPWRRLTANARSPRHAHACGQPRPQRWRPPALDRFCFLFFYFRHGARPRPFSRLCAN